jgi:ATP-binding cassette subfamily F protein uup
VLLLDEPTNHLDLDAIRWLEDLLLDFKGSVVTITHDRAFLDRVATRIVELDRGKLLSYPGNFSRYQQLKGAAGARSRHQRRADKLLAQEEVWMRKGVEARRTRSARPHWPPCRRCAPRAWRGATVGKRAAGRGMPATAGYQGKLVAELQHVSLAFGDKVVERLQRHRAARRQDRPDRPQRRRQDHAAQADPGRLEPDSGTRPPRRQPAGGLLRPDARRARPGRHAGRLHQPRQRVDRDRRPAQARQAATWATFCFSPRARIRRCGPLGRRAQPPAAGAPVRPPGQRAGARRADQRPGHRNLELLEELLQDYDGTVFLVSHDRTFLDNVVTSTMAWEGPGVWREYEGGVQDWLRKARAGRPCANQP